MFLHVTSARPLDGFRVEVCFDDGREGVADLTEAIEGPMFEPLKDPDVFRTLRVDEELRTIVWPNGADLAPEYIYIPSVPGRSRTPGHLSQVGLPLSGLSGSLARRQRP